MVKFLLEMQTVLSQLSFTPLAKAKMCMKVLQTLVWDGKKAGTTEAGTSVASLPGEALLDKTIVPPACSALSLLPAGNLGLPTYEHSCSVSHKRWQQARHVLARRW